MSKGASTSQGSKSGTHALLWSDRRSSAEVSATSGDLWETFPHSPHALTPVRLPHRESENTQLGYLRPSNSMIFGIDGHGTFPLCTYDASALAEFSQAVIVSITLEGHSVEASRSSAGSLKAIGRALVFSYSFKHLIELHDDLVLFAHKGGRVRRHCGQREVGSTYCATKPAPLKGCPLLRREHGSHETINFWSSGCHVPRQSLTQPVSCDLPAWAIVRQFWVPKAPPTLSATHHLSGPNQG